MRTRDTDRRIALMLRSRDVLAWRAAADLLEETGGDEGECAAYRRRADLADGLLPTVARLASLYTRMKSDRLGVRGRDFVVAKSPKQVQVYLMGDIPDGDRPPLRDVPVRDWLLVPGPFAALYPDLGSNPPGRIDYDRPDDVQWRYVRKRLADMAADEVLAAALEGGR